ncbi:Xaa-Pro dipeptidase [Brevibacillus reuszeri]|uniref:Amidohydrolase n=1 Tax=Brevibacillus reuszeri TaxID=54915 RepID=A0A0K9YXN7_9BACL|nr:amidohydrolase family protein [Brevibacillus reuszeri]KNB73426.1 amidohydrolase [Brevibacillus reuszeri]MED1857058.1 amidohydrolase family protein [Brevibacillus reuszeri]GED68185.1 Xaa-Pro dipeptidase [Brevibacillus reuszeri]
MKQFVADRVIIGDGEQIIDQGAVVVDEQGKIVSIGLQGELLHIFPQAEVIRYDGCTILPGLIDLHVHIGYWWSKPDVAQYNDGMIALMAAKNLQEALSLGVTTIRDVAGPDGLCRTLKTAWKKKYITSPRIFDVNQGIIMTGGHGWQLKGGMREANGPWEVRTAIREQVKAGADWIKLMTSDRTPTPEFTQEELDAAVDESHRLGKPCCVHASLQPAIQMAIDAGFDTIEHATFMTVEQAKQMAKKDIVWVPTMITFFQIANYCRKSLEQAQKTESFVHEHLKQQAVFFIESQKAYSENFARLMETGVKIATGTDIVLEGFPITPVADEIGLMVELGMKPIKAIQAGTQNAAEVLGQGQRFGTLQPGCHADLIVVKGNPLDDITALKSVMEVFQEGVSVFSKGRRDNQSRE